MSLWLALQMLGWIVTDQALEEGFAEIKPGMVHDPERCFWHYPARFG